MRTLEGQMPPLDRYDGSFSGADSLIQKQDKVFILAVSISRNLSMRPGYFEQNRDNKNRSHG
jgi:hypothetical protein